MLGKTLSSFLLLAALGVFVVSPVQGQKGGDTQKDVIQEINIKGLKIPPVDPQASVYKPAKITSTMELAKIFPAQETQEKISKQVDFKKQYLLYFRWTGSGGDKITPVLKMATTGPVIVFQYKAGLTDDVAHHARLFALKQGTKWEAKP